MQNEAPTSTSGGGSLRAKIMTNYMEVGAYGIYKG